MVYLKHVQAQIVPVIMIMVLLPGMALSASGRVKAGFYVATNGNDNWSGQLESPNADRSDGPFATLVRARDAIRQMKSKSAGKLSQPITVMVRGGRYYLDDPLAFGKQDSGARNTRITYTAYPN